MRFPIKRTTTDQGGTPVLGGFVLSGSPPAPSPPVFIGSAVSMTGAPSPAPPPAPLPPSFGGVAPAPAPFPPNPGNVAPASPAPAPGRTHGTWGPHPVPRHPSGPVATPKAPVFGMRPQLTLAQRLQALAQYVSAYVSPSFAAPILAGNFAALPMGTGRYDRNLPRVLEQAVMAAIARGNPADMRALAAALSG